MPTQPPLTIEKRRNGTIEVSGKGFKTVVDIRPKTPAEKLEAVRTAVLLAGYAWSKDVEKRAKKAIKKRYSET